MTKKQILNTPTYYGTKVKQTEAIKTLSENLPKKSLTDVRRGASTQLQYALWLDESSHSSSTTIIAGVHKGIQV